MKRVVTGHSTEGKSVFIEDGEPKRVVKLENLPGLEMTELWATDGVPMLPVEHEDPTIPTNRQKLTARNVDDIFNSCFEYRIDVFYY